MITLIIVKNPFKSDREIKKTEYVPRKPVYEYIQPYFMGVDVVVSRNGEIVSEEEYNTLIPSDGDYIAACPVIEGSGDTGKDIGRTLAIIALSIVTMGVGSLVAGGAFWGAGAIGAANWGFWSWVAAAGVQIAGGYLINQVFPPQQGGEQFDRKQTYGWSQMPPISTEGEAIPVTFGTVRMGVMAPIQMLTQRITTNGEKQYLNLLMSGGEGPIDSITDLKINDNPYNYYDGVEYEIRYGTNDQSVISNFNDTYFPHSISYKLEEDAGPSIHQLSGEYEGLEVVVNFPAGLYHIDESDGDVESNEVKIEIKYREIGASTWTSWGIKTISGKYTHAIQRVYSKHELPQGEYEVSVECTYKKYDGSSDGHDVYWTSVSGIIYDDFSYPNKALVGLKALATDQLSGGIPRISWTQTRENVWVWNPSSGTYEQKPANNPAWACYDIIHRCRRLKNINTGTYEYVVNGIPANRIDYQSFVDWADFCTDRGIEYNGIIYNIQTLWDALRAPEQAGRGRVLMRGTKFSCICDAPSEPVQLFTVSNIGIDSFREEYLGTSERANAIELTFYNIDNNYEETTIPIYGPGYDELTAVSNPTQVRLDFAMTLEQAYRYGAYQLRVNHYINRAVTWSADIDAVACQAGDVVLIQHDVPRWGYGGRLEAVITKINYFIADDFPAEFPLENHKIMLDQKVTLLPGVDYSIMIRYSDDTLIEKEIQGVEEETTTDIITVTEQFENLPEPGDIYSFGEVEKVAKPFRLTSISRDGDFRCTLQGMEYIEEVYTESENIPIIDYTRSELLPNPWGPPDSVQNLQVVEGHKILKDGTWLPTIKVSWDLLPNQVFTQFGNIYYSRDNGATWQFAGKIDGRKGEISGVEIGDYIVKVQAESKGGIKEDFDSAPTDVITINGKMGITETPVVQSITGGLRGLIIILQQPNEKDWAGFEVYVGESPLFEPDVNDYTNRKAKGKQLMFQIAGLKPGRTYYAKIRMYDESDNYSNFITAQGVTDGETVSSTVVIAASDSSEKGKAGADYVCDGGSDQTIINQAINSLPNGGKIMLLEGTYIVNGSILLKNKITLEGQGPASTIMLLGGEIDNLNIMERAFGNNNFSIRNLKIDGNKNNITPTASLPSINGMKFTNTDNVSIESVEITNMYSAGIFFTGGENATIVNNKITNCNEEGLVLNNTINSIVALNKIMNNDEGVLLSSAGTIFSENIIFGNAGDGIVCNNSDGGSIKGNDIGSNQGSGIYLLFSRNMKIKNNTLSENAFGGRRSSIRILYGENNSITENTCRVKESNANYGIEITNTNNNFISNNDLYQSGTSFAIYDQGANTNFGVGNRVNDGNWLVGADG